MKAPGALLASGREADIYEYGPRLVLRRSRQGRSMRYEARTMEYLRSEGYPVPAVEELSEDGTDLVMERIHGPSMVAALGRAPWTIRRQARVLADLHRRLHDIRAPEFLVSAPIGSTGDRVLHLDLHPLNVIIGPNGPVVIDWANACTGDPAIDVALAWVLISAGEIPGGRLRAAVLQWGRLLLLNGFTAPFDWAEIIPWVRPVVNWKVRDPHMTAAEVAAMWRAVETAEGRA